MVHSPPPHPRRGRKAGFTLPEILISMVIASILLGVATSTVMTLATGSESLVNYSEMNTQSRFALESLGRNLRSCSDVLEATDDTFRFERVDSTGVREEGLYKYDATKRSLTYTNVTTGQAKTLLTDVSTLDFQYYTLRHATTTNTLEVKHVQLEAELIRDVLDMSNRNYIISARFMLRNRRVSN